MSLIDFKKERQEAVKELNASDMEIEVTVTTTVPHVDDSAITYPDTTKKVQKCKEIETCVLYIDMRDSTDISNSHRRDTLAKLYSSFIDSMVRCANKYSGTVRGIVGDRVMVVFDKANCFYNAVETAILMNSVCRHVINKEFKKNTIRAGIGIDYGRLLVAKTGVVKCGSENAHHKSLVWLGRPANIASKLTDEANKQLPIKCSKGLQFSKEYSPSILITKAVYEGLKRENPTCQSLKKKLWEKQDISVSGYNDEVYGGGIIFTVFED